MKRIERYKHHGVTVAVRRDLRGRHREYCLCYQCKRFTPDDRDGNCQKANRLYALCVEENVTTPVWECVAFESKWGSAGQCGAEAVREERADMPRAKTMSDVLKALQKDHIAVQHESDVKMEDVTDVHVYCARCGRELKCALMCYTRGDLVSNPCNVSVCPDRPSCRRRRAEAEADRVRCVIDEVVI